MIGKIILAALTFSICAIPSPQQAPPSSQKVYVVGEVSRPGNYVLNRPTTVLRALVDAGGFTEHAAVDNIEIVRGQSRMKFNYVEVVQKDALAQNIILQNGDIIVVPYVLDRFICRSELSSHGWIPLASSGARSLAAARAS
jgi:SLBB domain